MTKDKKVLISVFSQDSSYKVPDGVEYIANHAFSGSPAKEIELPDSVRTIGKAAFACCDAVSITLNEGLEIIEQDAFNRCTNLNNIVLPSTLRRLGNGAFVGCENLSNVDLPDSLVALGENAFQRSGIKKLKIPNRITTLPPCLCIGCASLEKVTLHEGITCIGGGAFGSCTALRDIDLPGSITKIMRFTSYYDNLGFVENGIRYEYMIDSYTGKLGLSVVCAEDDEKEKAELVIPSEVRGTPVKEIREYAFGGNEFLTSIVIPSSVSYIGYCAFQNCRNLENVTFSEGLIHIGEGSFRNCEKLVNPKLPKSAVDVDPSAFEISSQSENEYFTTDDGLLKYRYFENEETSRKEIEIVDFPKYRSDYGDIFEIPEQINGIPVTSIREFYISDIVVKLPSGITNIEGSIPYNTNDDDDFRYSYVIDEVTHKLGLSVTFDYYKDGKYQWNYNDIGVDMGNNPENVVVPAEKDGYPVIEIGEGAFYDLGNSESTSYGYFGANINRLTDEQRAYCENFTHLKSVVLPDSIVKISRQAFNNCGYLTHINIPESVRTIGMYAFDGCSSLEEITLPASLDDLNIGGTKTIQSYTYYYYGYEPYDNFVNIFGNCSSLKRINVAEGNKYLRSVDGVLFSKDMNTLISYPGGKQDAVYTVPDGVKRICGTAEITIANGASNKGAFSFNNYIEEVILPEGLECIDSGAFTFCSSLKRITLPRSVTSVGYHAFYKSIYDFGNGDDISEEESVNVYIYRDSPLDSDTNYNYTYVIENTESDTDTSTDKSTDTDTSTDKSTDTDTSTDKSTDTDAKPIGNLGDIDGDNMITSADALFVLRMSVGLEKETANKKLLADADGDKQITSADALAVLRYSVGLSEPSSKINKPITV